MHLQLQEESEGQPSELQTCQPDVGTRKFMELIMNAITWHIQNNQGFMKGRSCLTNLLSFYDKVTCLVDEGKTLNVVYPEFSKAFDTVFCSILLEKLTAHGLDECALHWGKNLQDALAWGVVVSGTKTS